MTDRNINHASRRAPTVETERWVSRLHQQLHRANHRVCLVLCGQQDWRQAWLNRLIAPHWQGLAIGLTPPTPSQPQPHPQAEPLSFRQLPQRLGQETDFAIFTAEAGIEADALGLVGGLIRGGGLCLISLPPQAEFFRQPNAAMARFLNTPLTPDEALNGFQIHLWHALQSHALWLTEDAPLPPLDALAQAPTASPLLALTRPSTETQATPDQAEAIQAIHSVAFGHRKRPLLLTADRGRGKSTTLGLACVSLLLAGKRHLTLTAARLAQIQKAFDAIDSAWPRLQAAGFERIEKRPGLVRLTLGAETAVIRFQAPDDLIHTPVDTELLLVDEAAHLPLPMVLALLESHSRTLLATTEQGYEGSGRGFRLKLAEHLTQHFPGWKRHRLTQPIRWAPQDPLEATLNRLLLCSEAETDAQNPAHNDTENPRSQRPQPAPVTDLCFEYQSPLALAQPQQRAERHALFQLLSQAHYQTRPNDLMQLLSLPNQQLWVARRADDPQPLGVLFAVQEGGLSHESAFSPGLAENDMATQATQTRQPAQPHRVHGHLFPQLLAHQRHQPEWLALTGWRIQRLAVADAWQRQGIGQRLVKAFIAAQSSSHHRADYIAVSFGVQPGLVQFWTRLGFQPMHLGLKRDAASGQPSAALCHPLSERAHPLAAEAQQSFQHAFAWNLTQPFQTLDTGLALSLLRAAPPTEPSPFPRGYLQQQPFESIAFALRQWTLTHLSQLPDDDTLPLWFRKAVQHQAWSDVVAASPHPSRKALEAHFKHWLQKTFNRL
ncbi:MAG: GNAT family N-acetyltransferase [Hydrogenovibrio sp.]